MRTEPGRALNKPVHLAAAIVPCARVTTSSADLSIDKTHFGEKPSRLLHVLRIRQMQFFDRALAS